MEARMKMMTRNSMLVFHALLTAALGLVAAPASAELVVVVSSRNPAPAMSTDQVAAIFLGQAVRFPNGVPAIAVDQSIGTPQRDSFYLQVTGRTPALLRAYWSKMVFTGRGQPPREVQGDAAVRRLVAANPSMIGYINRNALDESVRPVTTLP
jgi:fructose-specific component phosphotransferase system IIB-like protein